MLRFQDEVAQRVVDGLRIPLSSAEQLALASPITTSADAYDLYVRARFHWVEFCVRSERNSLTEGQRLLETALGLDASFAQAHAQLSHLLVFECANWSDGAAERLARGRAAAERALALDPHLADAWIALGFFFSQTGTTRRRFARCAAARTSRRTPMSAGICSATAITTPASSTWPRRRTARPES